MIDIKDKVLHHGMNDFITKPFQPEELQAKIGKYVLNQNQDVPWIGQKKFSLDIYAAGDVEFKRELAALLIKNIDELQQAVQEFISNGNADTYQRSWHKVKPVIGMLGDEEFTAIVEDMSNLLQQKDQSSLLQKLDAFKSICKQLI